MSSREDMIWEIKETYGLDSPRVFKAILQVPRDKFVKNEYKHLAYEDSPVPIGFGQTMSQPYTVAFMTDLLIAKNARLKDKKVLEIGTGSGYQAAILSRLFKEVYTVEIIPQLAEEAKKKIKDLNYKNVFIKVGSGEGGWKENAFYDAVIITAATERKFLNELFRQLKVNGVLVAPLGKTNGSIMTKYIKLSKSRYKKEEHGTFYFVPFVEEQSK
jgi:protein-L-isoaspartate(D-aspartate) O-methyltransferase